MENVKCTEDEDKIGLNLVKYLHEKEFLNRDLLSIDRIINKYFNLNNRDPKEEKEVINFLFDYLEMKGKEASILFRHTQHNRERYNIIKRLYIEYRHKFEFNVINSSLFLASFDIIKINEKLKQFLYFSSIISLFFAITSISFYNQICQLKSDFHKQFNEKIDELKDSLLSNEKLVIELKSANEMHKNDMKINDQLGLEIKSLKNNLKEGMSKITKNYEKEKVCKKLLEIELEACKQNTENEKQCKKNLETELEECKQNYENEQIIKKQIEEELRNTINEYSKNQTLSIKINYKFTLYTIVDFIVFTISFSFFVDSYTNMSLCLVYSFICEILLNFQFAFGCPSFLCYCCFSFIFFTSIVALSFVSDQNDLSFSSRRSLMIPFCYIIIASVYKYIQIYQKEKIEQKKLFIFICVIFVLEMIYMFYIHYNFSAIFPVFIIEIAIFIYCCNFEDSSLFISNAAFIMFFFILIFFGFKQSKYRIFKKYEKISYLFGILSLFIQFCIFNMKKNDKIYYLIFLVFIMIEVSLLAIFHHDFYLFLIVTELCFSFLSLNYKIFLFIFISISVVVIIIFVFHESLMRRCNNKISLLFLVFTTTIKYSFLLFQFWKLYVIENN